MLDFILLILILFLGAWSIAWFSNQISEMKAYDKNVEIMSKMRHEALERRRQNENRKKNI